MWCVAVCLIKRMFPEYNRGRRGYLEKTRFSTALSKGSQAISVAHLPQQTHCALKARHWCESSSFASQHHGSCLWAALPHYLHPGTPRLIRSGICGITRLWTTVPRRERRSPTANAWLTTSKVTKISHTKACLVQPSPPPSYRNG